MTYAISKAQIEHVIDALTAITLLQGLSEQGEAQPVAWIWKYQDGSEEVVFIKPHRLDPALDDIPTSITPLFAHPPAPKLVMLSDAELNSLYDKWAASDDCDPRTVYKQLQQAFCAKNGLALEASTC